jgi:hypothetical protein
MAAAEAVMRRSRRNDLGQLLIFIVCVQLKLLNIPKIRTLSVFFSFTKFFAHEDIEKDLRDREDEKGRGVKYCIT